MVEAKGSGLFYHDTEVEIRLGDKVQLKRWLRRPRNGTVCYIPGISARHSELEYDDVRQWGIKLDDGTVLVSAYDPSHRLGQPKKNIIFVRRSNDHGIGPDEPLE